MTVYEKDQLTNKLEFLLSRARAMSPSRAMFLVIMKLDEARLWLNEVPTSDPDE